MKQQRKRLRKDFDAARDELDRVKFEHLSKTCAVTAELVLPAAALPQTPLSHFLAASGTMSDSKLNDAIALFARLRPNVTQSSSRRSTGASGSRSVKREVDEALLRMG